MMYKLVFSVHFCFSR